MAEITALNGAPLRSEKKVAITLEYELASGKLSLGGDLQNLDVALNVLGQAHRWLEARYFLQQQMILQAEIQRDQAIVSGLRQ